MKLLPNSTNGIMVLSDLFATSIFKQSVLHMFNKDNQDQLKMGFNATFNVQVSSSGTFVHGCWVLTGEHRPPKKSPSYKILPLVPGCSHKNWYIPQGSSQGCGTGVYPGLLGRGTWNKFVFIPNKSIIWVTSLGGYVFVGHNIALGHVWALLPFHTAFSTCLIGKRKWLHAWAIKSHQHWCTSVAVYFVGACTWLPNQVGMQMLVQKVVLMVPAYHLSAIIIVIDFWNVITTNTQT